MNELQEQTNATDKGKFNKANLPFFIALGMFILGISLPFITFFISIIYYFSHDNSILYNIYSGFIIFTLIFEILAVFSIPILCIISLILQVLHKEKTIFDKIVLIVNSIIILAIIFISIFACIAFPNAFVKDEAVRAQISTEFETLNKEYQPVLDYLAKYKKENGIYPNSIESVIPKSKTFDKYEYHVRENKKGYWLQVYPINGPIEYYYNDENDEGYEFYNGTGTIDSAFTNYDYYQIDKQWHAVKQDLITRHSKVFGEIIRKSEKETDEWMKDNVDKFDEKNLKEN